MNKSIFILVGGLTIFLSSNFIFSQSQGVSYTAVGKGVATTFVTDYHSLGINSSALGWGTGFKGKKITIGTTEFSGGISSPELNKDRLNNIMTSVRNKVVDDESFNVDQQISAASDYAESGINVNASYNWFGASYQSEKFGGIAISINEELNWFSQLNKQTTDLIFRGNRSNYYDSLVVVSQGDTSTISNMDNSSLDSNTTVIRGERNIPLLMSQITNGSRIKFSWNRNFNIGYGRKVFGDRKKVAIYAGIGARYIHSVAMFDFESNESGVSVNSSMTPFFNIQYEQVASTANSGTFPESVGRGYGLDFSASAIIYDRIKVAASVNNIGNVTYTKNVYRINDSLLGSTNISGAESAGIDQIIEQLSKNGGLLSLEGEEEVEIDNSANFRLGGSISFFKNKLDVGVDFVAPFNRDNPNSLQNPVFSVGGDIRPVKWLQLSVGYFGGGVYASNIPVGINFIFGDGTYEFGISSRDAISFFSKDGNSISSAFGVARFRF